MKTIRYFALSLICIMSLTLVSCSDEPSAENYYTFTGEMLSDYLDSRPEYSDFDSVVTRAGLRDLLATYGHYTCFLPSNNAFDVYLKNRGIHTISQLSDAECDTIARTHLVNNMYSTFEMNDGTLNTANMNGRYIQITHGFDKDSNSVVILNRSSQIYFAQQDDSVENGIVQPINEVLTSSNNTVADIMKQNPRISMFYEALVATGLRDSIMPMKDESWDPSAYEKYHYVSDFWHEVASVPDTKKYGFTCFVEPNEVYEANGIHSLKDMYDKACELYDPVYPEDVSSSSHDFDHLSDPKNPLYRFIAYHILNRDVIGWNLLCGRHLSQLPGSYSGSPMGIKTDRMNPIEWYQTLLPHTMMRMEQLTVRQWQGQGTIGQYYINRRYDDQYQIEGCMIKPTIEDEYIQDAPNGRYFYINDIVAFNSTTRDIVDNCRIRMDFSTIWPELMTNGIRQNGDPTTDDASASADDTYKNGRNYYFPSGYLDGVTFSSNCYLVYRRPHWNFWSYEGDEVNLFGDYDISFRLPPVPYEGEYQVRLGFCALTTRGVAQIYFDNKPQGIPLDMRKFLDNESIMGSTFGVKNYLDMTDEEKAEDQKALKNKGYYRGPVGGYHTDGSAINEFCENPRTCRIVLCQVHIDPKTDHYLRIRCTSSSKLGNNNEFMLDYLELVPKSVYGVTGEGKMEDDL